MKSVLPIVVALGIVVFIVGGFMLLSFYLRRGAAW